MVEGIYLEEKCKFGGKSEVSLPLENTGRAGSPDHPALVLVWPFSPNRDDNSMETGVFFERWGVTETLHTCGGLGP